MRLVFITNSYPRSVSSAGGPRLFSICKELSHRHSIGLIVIGEKNRESAECGSIFEQEHFISTPAGPGFFRKQLHRLSLSSYLSQRVRNPSFLLSVNEQVARICENYDIAVVQGLEAAQYCEKLSIPRAYDLIDCVSNLFLQFSRNSKGLREKIVFAVESFSIRKEEKKLLASDFPVVAIAKSDKVLLGNINNKAVIFVIPNGVDCEYFQNRNATPRNRDTILFTGTMSYLPNIEAAVFFSKKVFPQLLKENPKFKFIIAGKNPTEQVRNLGNYGGITVTGEMEDLRPHLFSSSIFVAPMFSGTGMKNKLLEAMASGIPIIATAESVIGIEASPGEHFIEANTPQQFVDAILQFDGDSALIKSMVAKAKKLVEEKYSWQKAAKLFEDVIETLG